MERNYYLMSNIGKAKYVVKFHNGETVHEDGSPFYGIAVFKNKKKRDSYVKNLVRGGYVYRGRRSGNDYL